MPSFISMFSKHMIYVIYFIQLLGWNKVFSYVRNEFFTVRHCRSFLGGHFSNRSPTFLLVPLRIFLGAYWMYEAIDKIVVGWLKTPALKDYFTGAAAIFTQLAGGGTVDIASSATEAATSAAATTTGTLFFNWNILWLFRVICVKTTDIAIMVKCGLMDWFNNTFVIANNGTQMFFQYFVVFSELLLGVLLIVGLFTTLSSAFSLGLEVMFLMSTGMYLANWWMIPAAIAMMFGAGRVLGLDYYIMPILKERWKKVKWVSKSYLYDD